MSEHSETQSILKAMQVKSTIEPHTEIKQRILFIKQTLKQSGLKTLVLGISGGIDSTTCGKICQLAVQELREEENAEFSFIAVRLPYGLQKDEADANSAIEFIAPDKQLTVDIKPSVDSLHEAFWTQLDLSEQQQLTSNSVDFVKGNTKARSRMAMQYHIAGLYDGLVVGTDHSSENLMGFFTKHGDGACDLAPLFGLNKRQVKAIAKNLGAPSYLVTKEPTADLEDNKPLQPDEISLGVTYNTIDDFLEGKSIPSSDAKKILRTYKKTQHKRSLPPTPR